MNELKLIDIARYMPHGLYAQTPAGDIKRVDHLYDRVPIAAVQLYDIESARREKRPISIRNIKPVLRPLSDLIVERNGITPLKELAAMAMKFLYEADKEINYHEEAEYTIVPDTTENDGFACMVQGREPSNQMAVIFVAAVGLCLYDPEGASTPMPCLGQYHLWDFLDYMKFDYRGLIEDGLAVDVNTLEKNPYEVNE
jgi:hypothetical protein